MYLSKIMLMYLHLRKFPRSRDFLCYEEYTLNIELRIQASDQDRHVRSRFRKQVSAGAFGFLSYAECDFDIYVQILYFEYSSF